MKVKTFIHFNNLPIENKYSSFRDYRSIMYFNNYFFNNVNCPDLYILTGENIDIFDDYHHNKVVLFSTNGETPVTQIIANHIKKSIYEGDSVYEFDISLIDKNVPKEVLQIESKGIYLNMKTSKALEFLKTKNNEYQNMYVYNDVLEPLSNEQLLELKADYYFSKTKITLIELKECYRPFHFDTMSKNCFFYEFCKFIYKK